MKWKTLLAASLLYAAAAFAVLYDGKAAAQDKATAQEESIESIVDSFDGKEVTYRASFKLLGDHSIDMHMGFEKYDNNKYKATITAKKKWVTYSYEVNGFECGNRLCPEHMEEHSTALKIFYYNTDIKFRYKDGDISKVLYKSSSHKGKKHVVFEKGKLKTTPRPVDALSGVIQQIYNLESGKDLEKVNVIWKGKKKKYKFKKTGDVAELLMTDKEAKKFKLKGLKIKFDGSWPGSEQREL